MNDNKARQSCQTVELFSVYAIWCRVTDQYYVGVTSQKVYRRICQHKRGKQFVDTEIQRLGWEENFDWWVVERGVPSERISDCEQKWVAFFDCVYPKGYNKTCGGISKLTVSDDTCEKIRKKALERDFRGKNNPHYGKKHTAEVNAANSARMRGENNPMYGKSPTNKGVLWTEERKATMSVKNMGENNPFFGKHHTAESNEKNRQAHLGKPLSEEHKAKLRGKRHSEETKALMRAKGLAREAAKRAAKAAEAAEVAKAAAEAEAKAATAKAVVEAIEAAKAAK